jgi:pyrroloquinoline quinone biosynthesis protein B
MRVRVLGSAAGGGFPQWNCGCANCQAARKGDARLRARTQDSIAVSADGEHWFLGNASPDIRAQLGSFPPLWPRTRRDTPIAGIVLTSGDIDHVLGLFVLRESQPLVVYATEAVWSALRERNALMRTLARFPEQLTWRRLELSREQPLRDPTGCETGLSLIARPAPGKLPPHLAGVAEPSAEDNVALWLRDLRTGGTLAYAPGFASGDALAPALAEAQCVLCDGTFYDSDELVAPDLLGKRAEELAHQPISGPGGSLAALAGLRGRRIYTHINNTNPILRQDSEARRAVTAAGWEVADDGLELEL